MLTRQQYDAQELCDVETEAGAIAGTTTTAVRLPAPRNGLVFTLDLTAAATDAGDTLDVYVQTLIDGTNWVDVVHFTQCLGNGGAKRYLAKIVAATAQAEFENATALGAAAVRHLLGDEWRVKYVQVDADSDASFAFTVSANPF